MWPPTKSADRSPLWIALVGVAGVAVGTVGTGMFNYLSHKGDIDAKLIELSVGILRADVKDETNPLREWAIDTIERRAGFTFTDNQRAALMKKELPFRGQFLSNETSAIAAANAAIAATQQELLNISTQNAVSHIQSAPSQNSPGLNSDQPQQPPMPKRQPR